MQEVNAQSYIPSCSMSHHSLYTGRPVGHRRGIRQYLYTNENCNCNCDSSKVGLHCASKDTMFPGITQSMHLMHADAKLVAFTLKVAVITHNHN